MQNLLLLLQMTGATEAPSAPGAYLLDAPEIFTLLFVTLGPLKLLGAFAHATATLPPAEVRSLALKATALAAVAAILGGFIGVSLMTNWKIAPPILELTAGIIFFLVAARMVMQPYAAHVPPTVPAAIEHPTLVGVVFPMVLTPYGLAAVILLVAMSQDEARTLLVLGLVSANMLLNLIAMVCSRWIMQRAALPLQVFGAVLAVLQVALALQIIYLSLRRLAF